jgi:hypothetical protein
VHASFHVCDAHLVAVEDASRQSRTRFCGVEYGAEMLRRAGGLKADHALFVKAVKPSQDYRFDVPCFGLRTLETMREAGLAAAALEAGRASGARAGARFTVPNAMRTFFGVGAGTAARRRAGSR